MGTYSSATRQGAYEPFDLQVARAQIDAHSTVNIYGYQPAVTSTYIPLWENAAAYTFPSVAQIMHVVGTDADTASILISGLDANYAQISETVVLNGTTHVSTVKSYLRINAMQVTAGNPAATVTLTDVTNTTTYGKINTGVGRMQASIYTVPAGYTLFLQRIDANTSFNGNNSNYVIYRNLSISPTGVQSLSQQAPFSGNYHTMRVMPRPFTEKTDLQIQCATSAGTAAVNVSLEGYLIKNAD